MSGLSDARIEEPTPLQTNVIPSALKGSNMLVKNDAEDMGAVLIPALQKLMSNGEAKGTKVLILTPSIEKAQKLDEMIWAIGYHAQISSGSLSMKGDRDEQTQILKDGSPIIVANPGRLNELLDKNKIDLEALELVVIDEAQGMEDYNLVKRVKSIMGHVKSDPQVLIFASEYNKATRELVDMNLSSPEVIGFESVSSDQSNKEEEKQKERKRKQPEKKAEEEPETASDQDVSEEENSDQENDDEPRPLNDKLEQGYIYVPPRMKISTLLAHLEKTLTDRIVVFAASKRTTDRLFRIIRKKGWGVVSVNDGLDENVFNERFEKFTNGDMKILLVGGLSATGIDLDQVNQVINYDVPSEVDEYRYRAELVGKGKTTQMISLVSKMDKGDINRIVNEVGYEPEEIPLPKEVKDKKKNKNKNKSRNNNKGRHSRSKDKNSDNKNRRRSGGGKNKRGRSDRSGERSRKKTEESAHDLPRPSFEGLSGGRKGKKDKQRPAPGDKSGPFGWIKKLFD